MLKALVLEGPKHSVMRGWVHLQVVIRLEHGQRFSSCIAQAGKGAEMAHQLRGRFFPRGTWEISECNGCGLPIEVCDMAHEKGQSCCPDCSHRPVFTFPAPRPEVLDLLLTERQLEAAI